MVKRSFYCKISRLPSEIVDTLNRRMSAGESDASLSEWLNSLDEAEEYIPDDYDNPPTNASLVYEWRQTGFLEWASSGGILGQSAIFAFTTEKIAETGLKSDHLLIHLTALYAVAFQQWDGHSNSCPAFERIRTLRTISEHICIMRKSEHTGQRLALDREKFEFAKSKGASESAPTSSPVSRSKPDPEASPVRTTPAKRSPKPHPPKSKAPAQKIITPAAPSSPVPAQKRPDTDKETHFFAWDPSQPYETRTNGGLPPGM